jgi:hypothetical protein
LVHFEKIDHESLIKPHDFPVPGFSMTTERILKDELSGPTAKSYVSNIARFHRIQGSPMYHEAALYVAAELHRMGLKDTEILQFPADGKHRFWTHQSTLGWSVKSAEIRLVEPKEKLLATFDDIPMSLHTFSTGTPSDGVTAELVDVGTGLSEKEYRGKKVKGKLVLATGGARTVHIEAVLKRGAAGVITDALSYEFPKVRESIDIPDAHSYQGIWPTAGNAAKVKFGFSLSKRQGNELRSYLRSGKKVKLWAKVDAKLFPGKYEVVSATIKGSSKPGEEVFLVAHLCHPKPGANDNASGSGTLLEIARTVMTLIRSGKMKRPARTIRFFWVPETTGTVALLATHPELSRRLVAGMNLDMVGEDQEKCKSSLDICMTPDSLPSYLNDLIMSVVERSVKELDPMNHVGLTSTFRYARVPFALGSDHAEFVEPTVGVPCVSLTHWPDLFYHTSMDTMDKVSEDSLRRVGWIAAITTLELANADANTGFALANLTCSRGLSRIAEAGGKASEDLFRVRDDPETKGRGRRLARLIKYHASRIEHAVKREQDAVMSVMNLGNTRELEEFVVGQTFALGEAGKRELARLDGTVAAIQKSLSVKIPAPTVSSAEKESMGLVPRRRFKGNLDWTLLLDFLGERGYRAYKEVEEVDHDFIAKTPEIVYLVDGKRTVDDIVRAVSAECGPTDHSHALMYLRDLERMKLISF